MTLSNNVERAFESLRNSLDTGRLAHAYLMVGSPRGDALHLASRFAAHLFGMSADKEAGRPTHPDLLWLEPRKKSRSISVDDMRNLTQRMTRTSYQGGWKVGIVLAADRMTAEAANASLKTLEEPPPKSCMVLVTESPEHILATIHSRCQRIFLSNGQVVQSGSWTEPLLELLRTGPPEHALQAVQRAAFLENLLKQAEKELASDLDTDGEEEVEVSDARLAALVHETRSDLLRCMQWWFRDILLCTNGASRDQLHFANDADALQAQAGKLTVGKALQNMEALEICIRRLERALPPLGVFESTWVQFGRIALS